jgi:hypothetical protein
MLRLVAVVVAVAGPSVLAGAVHADCADPLRDPDAVLDLHLRMTRATWNALRLDEPVGSGCDAQYPYHEVEFRCGDDEDWLAIGARHKRGDQRGLDTDQKPPIKLDFNRIVQGQRRPAAAGQRGFRKLSLNTGLPDNPGGVLSALLTEHLSWRLMHAEIPTATRPGYARLHVHMTDEQIEEYHGLYIVLEDIDRTAVSDRFGDGSGTLVKTTTGACRDEVVFDDGASNRAADGIADWLALDPAGSPGEWTARTDQALDLEELLRQEALRDILANRNDTVLGQNFSNFYAFDPVAGRRHYLPWDLDDALGPFPQGTDPDTPLSATCSPIGERTRCHPEIRPRYLEIACQLANGTLAGEKLLADLAALDALVRPIAMLEDDPVWPDDDPFDPEIEGTYAWQVDQLETWIPERITNVRAMIEDEGVSCPDGCSDGASEPCAYLACAGERRCTAGRWTTCQIDPALELPGDGIDGDCDGLIDEDDGDIGPDAGAGEVDEDDERVSGCGCRAGGRGIVAPWLAIGLGLIATQLTRRPRKRR